MSERTYEQLYEAALKQRTDDIEKGIDPKEDCFVITPRERLVILDRPKPCYELSSARDRICGLKLEVLRPSNGG